MAVDLLSTALVLLVPMGQGLNKANPSVNYNNGFPAVVPLVSIMAAVCSATLGTLRPLLGEIEVV